MDLIGDFVEFRSPYLFIGVSVEQHTSVFICAIVSFSEISEKCALYNLKFSQKERLLNRVARAATVVADKCDDIETTYVPLVLQAIVDDLTPVVGTG